MREILRVTGNTQRVRIGDSFECQFWSIRFTHDHRAGIQQTAHSVYMLRGRYTVKYLATVAGGQSCIVLDGIFDQGTPAKGRVTRWRAISSMG